MTTITETTKEESNMVNHKIRAKAGAEDSTKSVAKMGKVRRGRPPKKAPTKRGRSPAKADEATATKQRRSRTPKSFSVSLSQGNYMLISALAEATGVTRSDAIDKMIRSYLVNALGKR
jgi:hypothetical protein